MLSQTSFVQIELLKPLSKRLSITETRISANNMAFGCTKHAENNQSTKVNIWSAVPLPCFSFFFSDFPIVSRAAVPEGQCPVEYRGYFVRPSIRPSFVQGPCLQGVGLGALAWGPWPGGPGLGALAWGLWPRGLGRVRTEGRTKYHLYSTGHCPSGTAAQKE